VIPSLGLPDGLETVLQRVELAGPGSVRPDVHLEEQVPLDDGIAALRDTLSTARACLGATLDNTCQTITRALRQRGEDDITTVLARVRQ
jgi:hypothetical protein